MGNEVYIHTTDESLESLVALYSPYFLSLSCPF